ncbi:MAG: hypothetical protein H6Q20_2360 [Bacteroidetes bacterium]|nr:hypothetical protein [Bacteroidota bacterium]
MSIYFLKTDKYIVVFYMKKISFFLTLLFGASLILASCNDGETYAEQLKAEKELIADYIKRNDIKVVTTMPTKFPWDDNVYYKSSSGLYFRLEEQGDVSVLSDSIEANDLVVARYYQYTLNAVSDTISNWNTVDYAYPSTFNYQDDSQACTAWHEAVKYMKYNNSRARFIVYSKIGFSAASESVTPYGYDMIMKFQK